MRTLRALARFMKEHETFTNVILVLLFIVAGSAIYGSRQQPSQNTRPTPCLPTVSNEVRMLRANEPLVPCNRTDLTPGNTVVDTDFLTLFRLAASDPGTAISPSNVNFDSKLHALEVYKKASPSVLLIAITETNPLALTEKRFDYETGFVVTSPGGKRRVITGIFVDHDRPDWTKDYSIVGRSANKLEYYRLLPHGDQPLHLRAGVLDFAPPYPDPVQSAINKLPALKIGSTPTPGDRIIGIGYPEPISMDPNYPAHEPHLSLGVVLWTDLCKDLAGCGFQDALIAAKQRLELGFTGGPQVNGEGDVVAVIIGLTGPCRSPEAPANCLKLDARSLNMHALLPYLDDANVR